ncbi:hypothetical protein SLS61_008954 [Didymella pomorum]
MTPNQYTTPGCAGGAPGCPTWEEWQRIQGKKANKPLTGESSVEEDNGHSLAIRQKRTEDEAGVFYCKDVGWGGDCIYRKTPLGSDPKDCTQLNMEASSVGPDEGYYCIFYTNAVCDPIASDGSDTLSLKYPGNDNIGFTAKGNFNDRLLSYQCFTDEDYALDPMEKSKADAFEMAKAAAVAGGKWVQGLVPTEDQVGLR